MINERRAGKTTAIMRTWHLNPNELTEPILLMPLDQPTRPHREFSVVCRTKITNYDTRGGDAQEASRHEASPV